MNLGEFYSLLTAFFWSIAIILMKVSGDNNIRSVPLNIFKNFVSIPFFALAIVYFQEPFPPLTFDQSWKIVVSALVGITISDVLFVASINKLGAGLHAIVDCFYAPVMILMAYIFYGDMISLIEFLGGGLVLIAIMLGVNSKSVDISRKDLVVGVVWAIIAHLGMAVGLLMLKPVFTEVSLLWLTLFRFGIAGLFLIPLAYMLPSERAYVWSAFTQIQTWKLTIPLTFLGPFLATLCWFAGFKLAESGRAAIFNQMATFFTIIFATYFLKEPIDRRKVISVLLGFLGAVIVGLNQ